MDIRIASYSTSSAAARPLNVTTISQSGATLATAQSQPVTPVSALTGTQTADGGGYTDSVRGSIINILA